MKETDLLNYIIDHIQDVRKGFYEVATSDVHEQLKEMAKEYLNKNEEAFKHILDYLNNL